MNFFDASFLRQHALSILAFYDSRVIDPEGGYFQNYYDNGEVFNAGHKQLVSSTRIIVNYATAATLFDQQDYRDYAAHGLSYLEERHWNEDINGYAWTITNGKQDDLTQQAYGYAFVLLAYAAVRKAGIIKDNNKLLEVYTQLEEKFWQQDYGLYADEISPDGVLSAYRGQNANMHICEAMLAAYEATGLQLLLERAKTVAHNIAFRQADLTGGFVWEHFTEQFEPDWHYNKEDPKNLYRPWGFQPGHQTEWAKLLLILNQHAPDPKLVERAQSLFGKAFALSWDSEHGGLVYGFGPDNAWCDDDKYFWVQAESFAAAAMLYKQTSDAFYLNCYNALWDYCWAHFVDHEHGAWFRLLNRQNIKYNHEKSAAGAKCDYHTFGACYEVIRSALS